MPPDGEGAPLTRPQVATIRRWIDEGARWPASADNNQALKHWSFQKIVRPTPPKRRPRPRASTLFWKQNSIDAFILARLAGRGVEPSPVANRNTLIRRLYLDVLGLPPAPERVQAFIQDERPDAYALLVDEVLASKHYGERWGRHWLDLARYADTDGYEKDRPRPFAWRYRNWVIDALNNDMPFDEFSIRQIAGDMLEQATASDRIATGFHRNTLHNTEGGTDREEDRVKKTVDRINTTGAIWMGLTVGCAQCHSHKYDPLTQREYYSLYALLNNIDEADITAPTASEAAKLAAATETHAATLAKLTSALQKYVATEQRSAQQKWEAQAAGRRSAWEVIAPVEAKSNNGSTLKVLDDQSVLAGGKNTVSSIYTVAAKPAAGAITAIRLEVLPDPSLPMGGPGRSSGGNFVLSNFSAALRTADGGKPQVLKFASARADFSQNKWEVGNAINGAKDKGWAVSPKTGGRHVAVFTLDKPVDAPPGASLQFTLEHRYRGESHNLGRFRLSTTTATTALPLDDLPAAVAKALAVDARQRTAAQQKTIDDYFRTIDARRLALQAAVDKHRAKNPGAKAAKARAVGQRSSPRQAHVHLRGDFLSPGDAVEPGGPAFLPPLKSRNAQPGKSQPGNAQPDRLDLARWLFAPENPLTARVTVNRIWQRYFGRGIVRTSDDFGMQGDKPTHPQLLDWLACELRDNQWSLKHIHRLILTSGAYRQSSHVRPEMLQSDPLNTLVWRQPRRRVEAEIVRDLALAASGLLSRRVGGPSVRPPQPAGYSSLTYAGSAKWATSQGDDAYRRGMYTFFQRTSPYPMLMTFDTPDTTVCMAHRAHSNTPLQALTLWNDPVFFEAAQALGRRIMETAPAKDETAGDMTRRRVERAFMLTLARKPDAMETATLLQTYQGQMKLSRENPAAAASICGAKKLPAGAGKVELSAWIIVARVLLNLDEFITRE